MDKEVIDLLERIADYHDDHDGAMDWNLIDEARALIDKARGVKRPIVEWYPRYAPAIR